MIIIDKLYNSENIDTIIFDIDGTITRWKSVPQFLEKSLNILGVPYSEDALKGLFQAMKLLDMHTLTTGNADEDAYSYLLEQYIDVLKEYGVSGKDLKDTMFELEASETYISDETQEEFKYLSENYQLIAYTNWFKKQAIKKLDRYDLTKYFSAIHSPEDNFVKLSHVGFIRLLKLHNLNPLKTVHIGDSESDVIPSHKAGIYSIYLNYDIKSKDNIPEDKMKLVNTADATITEFKDIRKILSKKSA